MSQKLSNDQLREAYFKNHTTLKPFYVEQETPMKPQANLSSFKPPTISYDKINELDKIRFEELLKRFAHHEQKSSGTAKVTPPKSFYSSNQTTNVEQNNSPYQWLYDSKLNNYSMSKMESLKKIEPRVSRLEIDLRAQMKAQEDLIQEMKAQLELTKAQAAEAVKPNVSEYALTDDEDLDFLDSLVSGHSISESATMESLSDIFAKILENEKDSVSNYEPEVFEANIDELFIAGEDINDNVNLESLPVQTSNFDIPAAPEPIVPAFELPTLPVLEFDLPVLPMNNAESALPDFALPPLPPLENEAPLPDFELPTLPGALSSVEEKISTESVVL